MKLRCTQAALKRGLDAVSLAVAEKSSLPVLANVLLSTDHHELRLAATNLEIRVTHWLEAEVETHGAITVPARLLSEIVNTLPKDTLVLERLPHGEMLHLTVGPFTNRLCGIEADSFPRQPTPGDLAIATTMPASVLREALSQVIFATAKVDTRPILTGVMFEIGAHDIRLAAADTYRLAVRRVPLTQAGEAHTVVVPTWACTSLIRILHDCESEISIAVNPDATHVFFHTATSEVVSRLIDGRYPDINRVIPGPGSTQAIVDAEALFHTVRLATYFTSGDAYPLPLQLAICAAPQGETHGQVMIQVASPTGNNRSRLQAQVEGPDAALGLNASFLTDILRANRSGWLRIALHGPDGPSVFCPETLHGEQIHVVMPIPLSSSTSTKSPSVATPPPAQTPAPSDEDDAA
ncbi:MAG: DNA polymerase III subunit beta [Candidatus Viridilinea halotolerans]|uniref:Beta sliding clamp n=1 Tax=Candidatus Viridilinea halotolerans TaxID=2491704 RepID=A0A426U669_9CHLR|nr:MAG: DNA polymerase III subunit beta [Candidatus Viridilinea halotolerans]